MRKCFLYRRSGLKLILVVILNHIVFVGLGCNWYNKRILFNLHIQNALLAWIVQMKLSNAYIIYIQVNGMMLPIMNILNKQGRGTCKACLSYRMLHKM